jgi:hypothetical protein
MATATATKGTAEQARLIASIWDLLVLMGRPATAGAIRTLVTDGYGEFLSETELRSLNLELKKQYRG